MTSYGVAKAAQDRLTKDLAFEFAAKGVRINSVLPGRPHSSFLGAGLTNPASPRVCNLFSTIS